MTAPSDPAHSLDPLFLEGLDWVARMGSGEFLESDRAQLLRWRARSARHDDAFRQAAALGGMVRDIAAELSAADGGERATTVTLRPRRFDRRVVLTGAVAASVAGVLATRAPVGSPVFGRAPDFTTGTGERRTVALAPGLQLELDARTSIAVDRVRDRHIVELINGRAAVDARLASGSMVDVVAGKGRTLARRARFDVDASAATVCMTCVSGAVLFDYEGQRLSLGEGRQLIYSDERVDRPRIADIAAATAWTAGQLVFHRKRLAEVIDEINRYRPGKVVLLNGRLSDLPINAVFHIAQIEGAIGQLQQVSGARVIRLPGNVVLFS